ncbi:tachykinin-like peptides receptor 99D [Oppia nitens]|uniref:tachykinin-like peptides receptor 99D n=1 Tax=Oppia nitens TaxID=1686743 RepID=UPI0023D9F22F|nr:tachykinin-like peptides receptor 99D [Oppia nitens]
MEDLVYIIPNATSLPSFAKLYDVPIGLIVLLAIAYGTVSLCAIIGNGVVLWIVVRSHRMRTVTNIFLANLAFADMLIGALSIPFQFQSALLQRWLLPQFMCPFCPFINVVSVNVSIFTLTSIAIDRYIIVVNPLWPRLTKRKAQGIIIAIWIVAIITALPMYVALGVSMIPDDVAISKMNLTNLFTNINQTYNEDNYLVLPLKHFCHNIGISPELLKLYNRFLVVIQYFLPVLLISGAYGRMAYTLYIETVNRRDNSQRQHQMVYKLRRIDAINHRTHRNNNRNQSSNTNQLFINREKRKVLKLLVIIVVLFALFWLPLQTYNAISDIFPQINEYEYINIIWFCCHWLAMSNSVLLP